MPLRVFTLYANPVAVSFGAALLKQTVAALRSRGHEMDDCELHAESFNSVMGEQERMQYHDVALNRGPILQIRWLIEKRGPTPLFPSSARHVAVALSERSRSARYISPTLAQMVTVWRQLIDADPGKRAELAIGILF
jgi:hypothetical protein